MIAITKLNKEDIITLCQIIGNNDILIFLNKNNISTLKYKHNKSLSYSPAYYVMAERYQSDERVTSFLDNRTKSIITKIVDDVIKSEKNQSDAYFTLTASINTRFHGHGKLFCKIIGENNLKDYIKKLNFQNNNYIDKNEKGADTKMEDEILIIKQSNISLSTSRMDRNVIALLIRIAGVETASKIVPGMWMNKTKAPDETQLCDYFLKNKQGKLTNDFLIKQTKSILEEIYQNFDKYNKKYSNSLKASLQALYESPFKNHPEYYLKITNQSYSAASIKLIKEFFRLPYIIFETDDSLESQKVSELNKRIQDLENIIQQRNNESEQRYSDYETKIADLENSKKETNEALIAAEAEIANLLKVNKEYEEKAAANNDEATILSSEKEALISEIKQLKDRKKELLDEIKLIKDNNAQLISQKTQLQNSLDNEIKRFSNDFVHSTAITALLKQVNHNGSVSGRTIFIDVPEPSTINASNENKLLTVTEILAENLFSAGMQKHNDILAKMILPTLLCKGCFIVYGNEQSNVADAISLAIYAEYAAHVVLPMDISDIPYFIEEISKISRSVIYIENALDTYTDRLCSALIKYCKGKIFVFAANDYDSLKRLKGSSVFEKCLYLNTEFFSGYLAKPEYKVNSCNLAAYQEKADVYDSLIKKDYVTQLFRLFNIPPSVSRFWTRITAVHCNIYNTPLRKSIIIELIMTLMIKDSLCSGSYNKIHDYINENEDTKLDLLDGIVAEDMNNESNN